MRKTGSGLDTSTGCSVPHLGDLARVGEPLCTSVPHCEVGLIIARLVIVKHFRNYWHVVIIHVLVVMVVVIEAMVVMVIPKL